MDLVEAHVDCPYCWQTLTIFLDPSLSDMDYVEDCHVCCQPIRIQGRITDAQEIEWIDASRENE